MTEKAEQPAALHLSPRAIRDASFSHRRRGVDEAEVRQFLHAVAEQIQATDAERARLRAEIETLRRQASEAQSSGNEISPQAIALFSQAQQVADSLVAEAVDHAREVMLDTRKQQRDILQHAHDAAKTAAGQTPPEASAHAERIVGDYNLPVSEIEYVRTFARVAQVQLRSVLDALTEQVDRLGDVPRLDRPATQQGQSSTDRDDELTGTATWQLSATSAEDDATRRGDLTEAEHSVGNHLA